MYYIHYTDFNRRMDEWVGDSRIVHLPSVANIREADRKNEEAAAALNATLLGLDDGSHRTHHFKRKQEDTNEDGPTTIDELGISQYFVLVVINAFLNTVK